MSLQNEPEKLISSSMKRIFLSVFAFALQSSLLMAQTVDPAPYCAATYHDLPDAVDNHIVSVQLNTLSNLATTGISDYTYYNNLEATELEVGNNYILNLTHSGAVIHRISAWIDYNANFVFDENELIGERLFPGLDTETNFNFTIPNGAVNSLTRLRIRVVEDDPYYLVGADQVSWPCESPLLSDLSGTNEFAYGETEDYDVEITGGVGLDAPLDETTGISLYDRNTANFITGLDFPNSTEKSGYDLLNHSYVNYVADTPNADMVEQFDGDISFTSEANQYFSTGNDQTLYVLDNAFDYDAALTVQEIKDAFLAAGDAPTKTITGATIGDVYLARLREAEDYVAIRVTGANNSGLAADPVNIFMQFSYKHRTLGEILVETIEVSGLDGVNTITDGGDLQMVATVLPSSADETGVVWSVEGIDGEATISPDGLLSAVSSGTVTVTATALDGSGITGTQVVTIAGVVIPGFTFNPLSNTTVTVCGQDEPLVFEYELVEVLSFSEQIALSAVGPAGMTFDFDPAMANAGETVLMTVHPGTTPSGYHTITVTGTPIGVGNIQTSSINYHLIANFADVPVLSFPANGALNVPVNVEPIWLTAQGATSYDVQVSDDIYFDNIVAEVDYLTATTFDITEDLEMMELYYWRVRSNNFCGKSEWSAANTFYTVPPAGAFGCTDEEALNYNPTALVEDGSCNYPVEGCTDEDALNYNEEAVFDDGSCSFGDLVIAYELISGANYNLAVIFDLPSISGVVWEFGDGSSATIGGTTTTHNYAANGVYNVKATVSTPLSTYILTTDLTVNSYGCTNPLAMNFSTSATVNDGSCIDIIPGCLDGLAFNFSPLANTDDGSCIAVIMGCMDETAVNYNPAANTSDDSCIPVILGCVDPNALNFNPIANTSDDSCEYPVFGCTDDTAFNYDPTATNDDGSCVDVVLGCIDNTALNFNSAANTDDGSCVYPLPTTPDWTLVPTGDTHTIVIPSDADINTGTAPIEVGDYIGVFYEVGNVMLCGGYTAWTGENAIVTAFGANPGSNDGFQNNETFVWQVWDASTNNYINSFVTYDETLPDTDKYKDDGVSGLTSLGVITAQDIVLNQGWNLFSTYLNPQNKDIADVMAPVADDLYLVKDFVGNVYWPEFGLNNIGDIEIGSAYKSNMTAATVLQLEGEVVRPEEEVVALPFGWSYIGYLRQAPANISSVTASITDDIFIMKDGAGNVYWPTFGINNIGNMEPGKGYLISMDAPVDFTFPANEIVLPSARLQADASLSYYQKPAASSENMLFAIPSYAWDVEPAIGSEIAVYDENKQLVGASLYQGTHSVVTIWGDETSTESKEGLIDGETYTVHVWDAQNGEQEFAFDTYQGNTYYTRNGVTIVSEIEAIAGDAFATRLLGNVPNPFTSQTEIRFATANDTEVSITVFNVLGELVEQIAPQSYEAGTHNVVIDASGWNAGTYYYTVKTNDFTATKIMNVVK